MADRVVPGPVDSSACIRSASGKQEIIGNAVFFNGLCMNDVGIKP